MPKSSYDILLQKYNTLIAKAKDLQGELKDKTDQLAKRESQHNVTVELARELCEMILPNDRSEMKLGVDYSWSSIEINQLIAKTKTVYTNYTKENKRKLEQLLDANEERGRQIEALEDQIEYLRRNNVVLERDELEKKVEEEKEIKELKETLDKGTVFNHTDHQLLTIGADESDAIDAAEKAVYEAAAIMAADMQSEMVQISSSSIPIKETKNRTKAKKKIKQDVSDAFYADLSKFEEKLEPLDWAIIEAIGKKGLSRYQMIEQEVLDHIDAKAHQVRMRARQLHSTTILSAEHVSTPWNKLYVYSLSEIGTRIFKRKYGEDPVIAEVDIVRSEHDNCEHGYGIVLTAEMMREDKFFKTVKEYNRKEPIKISEGSAYIPDIVCVRDNGSKMYIEYECANHTQADFDAKCNKMCKVTSVLNFITPNIKTEEAICTQVGKWIQSRGAKNLGHITIRVTTAKLAKGVDLNKDKCYKSVFRPKTNGKVPITNM